MWSVNPYLPSQLHGPFPSHSDAILYGYVTGVGGSGGYLGELWRLGLVAAIRVTRAADSALLQPYKPAGFNPT